VKLLGRARGPIVVGHRGGRGDGWPTENTLFAFERARGQGAHAVELDVRLCGSGEVVVLHDPTLARVTRGRDTRAIARTPWHELAGLEAGDEGERVPRLIDVLEWADANGCALNVEIKHDVPDRWALVRRVVRDLRGATIPLLVSSFDPLVLVAMGLFAPRVARALLTDSKQAYARALHAVARPPRIAALHVERRQAAPDRIARWKKRGLVVGVWTVNDPKEARRLADSGVDILITDEPGRIVHALEERAERSKDQEEP
jgi:glycerophosphoryl diester phosphodiesterase